MRRLILAILAVLVVALLVWWRVGTHEATPAAPAASPAPASDVAHAGDRRAEPALPAAEVRPQQPVPVSPSSAPSLDAPHSQPAPAQKAFTREEVIAKRAADLELLDATKARLEADLAAAHDATAQHDLEVRLTRLTALRDQRAAELDALRAGGALPP